MVWWLDVKCPKQARKPGRCFSYLRNLKLSFTHFDSPTEYLPRTRMFSLSCHRYHRYWQFVAAKSLQGKFKLDGPAKICNNRPYSTTYILSHVEYIFMNKQASSKKLVFRCIWSRTFKVKLEHIKLKLRRWHPKPVKWYERNIKFIQKHVWYAALTNAGCFLHLGMTLLPIKPLPLAARSRQKPHI